MVRIAQHLIKRDGDVGNEDSDYVLCCAWPDDDTVVQWGSSGIVLEAERNRRTAFFEVFPNDGSSSFLRGEGATLRDAEEQAYKEWQRTAACAAQGHMFSRNRRCAGVEKRVRHGRTIPKTDIYTNGAGWCVRCGGFISGWKPAVFSPGLFTGSAVVRDVDSFLTGFLNTRRPPATEQSGKLRRIQELKLRRAGISIPDPWDFEVPLNLFGPTAKPYLFACRMAVGEWFCSLPEEVQQDFPDKVPAKFAKQSYTADYMVEKIRSAAAAWKLHANATDQTPS